MIFKRSIRTKLKVAILSTTFLAVAVVFVGFFAYERVTYDEILVNDLSTKADIIAENSDAALAFSDSVDATQVLKSLSTQPHIMTAAIYDRGGRLFASYRRDGGSGQIPLTPPQGGSQFEVDALVLSKPIMLNNEQVGTIYVSTDLLGRDEHFRSYIEIALCVLFLSLAIAFVVATVLEKTISKPILGLADITKQVSEQRDYSIRASKVSDDETGFLADAVNQMLVQIQERDDSLRHANSAMVEEIVERKRVEEALRVAETQLRIVTDTTPLLLTRCNRERQYIYVNHAVTATLNMTSDQIIGRSIREVIGEAGYQSLSPYIEIVLQGKPVEFETQITFPRGQQFFRAAYTPDKDERGNVIGWFGSISDITESRLADRALRASEERFRQFMSNLPGAAWIKDYDGRYVYANEESCRIFDRTSSELFGNTDEEIFPPETARQFRENDRKAMESGTGIQTIETILQGDGIHYSIVTKFPILGHDGKPVFIGGIAIDITERKRVEEALHASEERSLLAYAKLAAIVESSSDAIISLDIAGTVMSWNGGAERILGYKAEEIIGRPVFDLLPPEDHVRENNILEDLRRGERVDPYDTIRIKKGGQPVHVSLSISPIRDSSGHIIGSSKIARDITERKLAEDAIRESERRFRTLVLALPVALYTTDREGRITLFNEPAAKLWGRRPEIGKDVWCGSWRIFGSDGDPMDLKDCPMAVSLRENRPIRGEEIIVERPDGTKSYVLPYPEPTRDSSGQLTGAINMLVDITDRKQAEEALRKAHDELEIRVKERTVDLVRANEELQKRDVQLSTAQQIARLGSWEWDLRTSEVTWSEELYRIYGLHHGEFGQTLEAFLEHLHPDDRATTMGHIQESMRTQQPFDFEERILRPDGSVRMLHSQGRVVKDENGQVVKLLGVCLDVTDRKRAEEKFRGLLESAPDAMIIAQQDGRIVLVNAQTERLFGYSRLELLGQQVEMLLPKRFQRVQNYFITPSALQLDEELELFGLRKNNTEFPVEVSLSPLETEDGMLVASAIRDITEQRRLRSRLLAAERQRSTDLRRYTRSVQRAQEEERQRIARELHDDLCQRLSGMKLNVEVIADEMLMKDRGLHRKLQSFNKQCEEMIVEVRRMSVNLRPAVLDDFGLSIALGLLTRDFKKLHKIPVNLEMDESARLQLDPQLEIALYRIAQEALSNIAKHAHASMVTVALQKNNEEVVLRISDNGKGLNPDEVPRKDALHGLGLIGMRERTSLLGGGFSIESTKNGTTITVTIPLTIEVRNEEDAPSYS